MASLAIARCGWQQDKLHDPAKAELCWHLLGRAWACSCARAEARRAPLAQSERAPGRQRLGGGSSKSKDKDQKGVEPDMDFNEGAVNVAISGPIASL